MSTITINVGQCGNQIGEALLQCVANAYRENKRKHSSLIHLDGKFRSLSVDSEPKVVNRFCNGPLREHIREGNVMQGRAGCGSNWALGYHGLGGNRQQCDRATEAFTEALRKEIERCDSFSGVIFLHSMAGGTGSGFGCRLTECIRDDYPAHYIMNAVVVPFRGGESPLQHYNALFTLSHLQRCSDCIVLLNNDEVLKLLSKAAPATGDTKSVSYQHINAHFASALANVLLPTESTTPSSGSGISIGSEPWEIIRSLCPLPHLKCLHIDHISSSGKKDVSWSALLKQLHDAAPKYHSDSSTKFSTLANLAIVRGDSDLSLKAQLAKYEQSVQNIYSGIDWNPFPTDFWIDKRNVVQPGSRHVTLASNNSCVTSYAEQVYNNARIKFEAGAYCHWYNKYGCDQETFLDAFETVKSVIEHYKEAVSSP